MDKITYLAFLEGMTRFELEKYLTAVWKGKIEINEAYEGWLEEFLQEKRISKPEFYVKVLIFIWALLIAMAAYQGAIRRIAEKLPVPDRQEYPWDLKWTTHPELGNVCELCKALEGKS